MKTVFTNLVARRTLSFLAAIFDVCWVFLSFAAGMPLIAMTFGLRSLVACSMLRCSFLEKTSAETYLRQVSLWFWLGAVAGLLIGHTVIFLFASLAAMYLFYSAGKEKTPE